MHNLNPHLGLLGHLLPDMYDALSINDFLDNKDKINHSTSIKKGILILVNPGWLLRRRDFSVIDFWNVSLRHASNDGFIIYDLASELYIKQIGNAHADEGRYSRVRVRYYPSIDNSYFLRGIKSGPPVPHYLERKGLGKITDDAIVATL